MKKDAIISEDGKYRYSLSRIWDESKPYVLFICLNPSRANEIDDDPTLKKCIAYAKKWGYGGVKIGNLFAFRTPYPKEMFKEKYPIGPKNDYWIDRLCSKAGCVVAAWGEHGVYRERGNEVLSKLSSPNYLTLLKNGQPGHPLYKKTGLKPKPF